MTANLTNIMDLLYYHFLNMLAILRNITITIHGVSFSWYTFLIAIFLFSIIIVALHAVVRYRKNDVDMSIEGRR